jgi:phage-related protein
LVEAFDIKPKFQGILDSLGELTKTLQNDGLKGLIEKWFPPKTQQLLASIGTGIMFALVPAFIALAGTLWAGAVAAWALVAPLIPFFLIGAAIGELAYLIVKNWSGIVKFFSDLWTSAKTFFAEGYQYLSDAWDAFTLVLSTKWNLFKMEWHLFWTGLWNKIVEVWTAIKDHVLGAFIWLYDHNYYVKALVDKIVELWTDLKTKTREIWTSIKTWFQETWDGIAGWFTERWNNFKAKAGEIWTSIKQSITKPVSDTKTDMDNTWTGIFNGISSKWNHIKETVSGYIGDIKQFFVNLVSEAYGWGANLLKEFIAGMKSKVGALKSEAKGAAGSVATFLGFHSPAKEGPGSDADKWAPNLMKMFSEGLMDGIPFLESMINKVGLSISQLSTFNRVELAGVPASIPLISTDLSSSSRQQDTQEESLQIVFTGPVNITNQAEAEELLEQAYEIRRNKGRGLGVK